VHNQWDGPNFNFASFLSIPFRVGCPIQKMGHSKLQMCNYNPPRPYLTSNFEWYANSPSTCVPLFAIMSSLKYKNYNPGAI
jgi:hypothetical protein